MGQSHLQYIKPCLLCIYACIYGELKGFHMSDFVSPSAQSQRKLTETETF